MNVITITGTGHYHGQEFITPGMKIRLIKDPDNEYDREAIRAELKGLGKIGYVANSPHTVIGESMSAGRLYDKIGDTAKATVLYVLPRGILCRVKVNTQKVPVGTDHDVKEVIENSEEEMMQEDTINGCKED